MAYLIDGNNLLGHISSLALRDPQSKFSLALKLLLFQGLKRTRIILVFDGTPDPSLMDEKFKKKKFSIIYPPLGQNADAVIKELILKQTDRRKLFVVSSDRDIKDYAKANRAKTLSSKEFHGQLKKAWKEHRKAQELEKKVLPSTPLELSLWLEVFSKKK